ncbi:hypothetical protein ABPG72_002880 [Tetrahymena utriculariae]
MRLFRRINIQIQFYKLIKLINSKTTKILNSHQRLSLRFKKTNILYNYNLFKQFMSQVSSLMCPLHTNKAIGWLCLEKECFSRVMCNVCAVKNHNKNHKVEELESLESKGLLFLVLNSIQNNSNSKNLASNSNTDSSSENFNNKLAQQSNHADDSGTKNKIQKNERLNNTQNKKTVLNSDSQAENQAFLANSKKNQNQYENLLLPIKKKLESIEIYFNTKKQKIVSDYKEQLLKKKQQKEAALSKIQFYENSIKISQDIQEIQKLLDEAIQTIYSFTRSPSKISNSNISQEDDDDAIFLRPLSSSGSVIKCFEEQQQEEGLNEDLEQRNDSDFAIYEAEDQQAGDESEIFKSLPEDAEESDIETNNFQNKSNLNSQEVQNNQQSDYNEEPQSSGINQTSLKVDDNSLFSSPSSSSKKVYLKKLELINQLQNYFLELTKIYLDNQFTQDFTKLVKDQIDSILNLPSKKLIKSERIYLNFIEQKWQADYNILQYNLNDCIQQLKTKISEYISNKNVAGQVSEEGSSCYDYLLSQFLNQNRNSNGISINESSSRIRLLQSNNFPIQSPILQGPFSLPQMPQQVILAPVHHALQVPYHQLQNNNFQLQNRILIDELPQSYQGNQQQYFTTIRQQGVTNQITTTQQIHQQHQLQQHMISSAKQNQQQKFGYYQQAPQSVTNQISKPQFIPTINYNQVNTDQQLANQVQFNNTQNQYIQNPPLNQNSQFVRSPIQGFVTSNASNQNNIYQQQSYNTPNSNKLEKPLQMDINQIQSRLNTPLTKQLKLEKNQYMQTTPFSHQKNNSNIQKGQSDNSEDVQANNIAINLQEKVNDNDQEENDPNSPINFIQKKGSGGLSSNQSENKQ